MDLLTNLWNGLVTGITSVFPSSPFSDWIDDIKRMEFYDIKINFNSRIFMVFFTGFLTSDCSFGSKYA